MAHQDYVSRKANKKHNPYKAKNEPSSPVLSLKLKAVITITLCAILAFAYGLWKLNDKSEQGVQPSQAENKTVTTATKTQLPEPPKEKWEYLEQLKTKEVEEGQYEVETKGPYKLQCGSFKTMKQAEVLKANIAFAGLESSIKVVQGTSSTWHQVYLGPYSRKRAAEKDKHRLRSNRINYCQILLWK
ncbi:SPOR domain-containing protein [Thalassotalea ganghwensis]